MNFKKILETFPKQFLWKPKLENAKNLKAAKSYIIAGMGGSLLSGNLITSWDPALPITLHNSYGLPAARTKNPKDTLFIASSYSGNTEEVIDALSVAIRKKIPSAVVATGGTILRIAKRQMLPYIQLPRTGIQPRSATGYSTIALLTMLRKQKELKNIVHLERELNVETAKREGKKIAEIIWGKIPIIYASHKNRALAYNWKIRFNESGKITSFYNVLPELNHNEMMGFDYRPFARKFHVILIKDNGDHPRIIARMRLTEKILRKKGVPVTNTVLKGKSFWGKAFSSLMAADWASYITAARYGKSAQGEQTIESFKKLLSKV